VEQLVDSLSLREHVVDSVSRCGTYILYTLAVHRNTVAQSQLLQLVHGNSLHSTTAVANARQGIVCTLLVPGNANMAPSSRPRRSQIETKHSSRLELQSHQCTDRQLPLGRHWIQDDLLHSFFVPKCTQGKRSASERWRRYTTHLRFSLCSAHTVTFERRDSEG
jgi:hypothetical protein